MGGFQQQYPGAYAGGSPEDDYSGYGPVDPSQIPPPPQVQPQGPAPDYLGLPWRRKKIPAVPQLAGNPMVSDTQGITGQGPLMAPGPQAQAQPQPQAPSMPTPAPAQLASTNIQQAPLPQQPRLAPGAQGQPMQPPPSAQVQADPYIQQITGLLSRSLPQQAPQAPKAPTGARAVIGGLLGAKHPALGQLVEYGPKGMAQMQQMAQFEKILPQAIAAGQLSSQDLERRQRAGELVESQAIRAQKEREDERKNRENEYNTTVNNIRTNKGYQLAPGEPVPEGYNPQAVTHPSGTVENWVIPTAGQRKKEEAEATRTAAQAGWEPLPKKLAEAIGLDPNKPVNPANIPAYLTVYQKIQEDNNPNLEFEHYENNITGDVTSIGRDKKTGKEVLRDVIKGAAKKYPPAALTPPDQSMVQSYVGQMQQNPEVFHEIKDSKLKDQVGQAWTAATGLPAPQQLDTNMKSTEAFSRRSLENIDTVKQLLNDPAVMKRIGPALGRIGNAEQDVGATAGLSPADAQKVQKLRSSLTYLFLGEGRQLFGGRPPQQLMEKLSSVSPRVSETLPMLNGAIDAVATNAYGNITAAEKSRFGGKTRQGFDPTGGQTPQAQAVPPLPLTLASGDVNKVFTNKDGKTIKVTEINPSNPKQFKFVEVVK